MDATQMEIDHPFLTELRSWKKKRVYDVAKRGQVGHRNTNAPMLDLSCSPPTTSHQTTSQDDWYSSIGTQASVIQEDFAAVTHGPDFSFLDATGTKHSTVFLRDIFEEEVGTFGECQGEIFESLAEECVVFAEIDLSGAGEKVVLEIAMVNLAAAVVMQGLAMMVGV